MDLAALSRSQYGVVSRAQALERITRGALRHLLARKDWQLVHPGVYATHDGPLDWLARASAAQLNYGPGSALALESAAFLLGINDKPPPLIQVFVPHGHPHRRRPGTRVRQARHLSTTTAITTRKRLTVTAAAQTVIDLADQGSASRDDAIAVAARAVQRGKASVDELAAELAARRTHRHRTALVLGLGVVAEGAESVLEVGFAVGVIAAHGLPPMSMAVPDEGPSGRIRRDFLDLERGIVVETDGVLGHDGEFRRRDNRRDRSTAAHGGVTLRTDWVEVHFEACTLAADLASTQSARGWTGTVQACRPGCPAPRLTQRAA